MLKSTLLALALTSLSLTQAQAGPRNWNKGSYQSAQSYHSSANSLSSCNWQYRQQVQRCNVKFLFKGSKRRYCKQLAMYQNNNCVKYQMKTMRSYKTVRRYKKFPTQKSYRYKKSPTRKSYRYKKSPTRKSYRYKKSPTQKSYRYKKSQSRRRRYR